MILGEPKEQTRANRTASSGTNRAPAIFRRHLLAGDNVLGKTNGGRVQLHRKFIAPYQARMRMVKRSLRRCSAAKQRRRKIAGGRSNGCCGWSNPRVPGRSGRD